MNLPLVSIVIPCYKVAPFVTQCIKSVLRQAASDIECIAVDDCSTDDTGRILDELALHDTRLNVIHLKKNGGVSNARNKGMGIAKGQWLMFVDGDDFLPPDSIERLLNQSRALPEAALICANATLYDANGVDKLRPHFRSHGKVSFNAYDAPQNFQKYQEHFNNCCFKLFKRDLIGEQKFQSDLCYGEDTLFCHQFVLNNHALVSIDYDTSVYGYRQISTSCIHAASLQRRTHDLEAIITALNDLQRKTKFPLSLTQKKAAEYLWVIKKFASCKNEQHETIQKLMTSSFYLNELHTPLHTTPKLRHRIILFLLEHGVFSAIKWW